MRGRREVGVVQRRGRNIDKCEGDVDKCEFFSIKCNASL